MSFINRKQNSQPTPGAARLNWWGSGAFDVKDPLVRLRMAATSCFFGEPMYYHRDVEDTRHKKRPRYTYQRPISDAELAYLRAELNALDPQEWRGMAPAQLMETAIDAALEANPEATLQFAAHLRQQEHIRTTPQVILVRAANHPKVRGTGLIRTYAPQIIARMDEPSVGLAYQMAKYGKPIPNALKKAWRAALESASEYQLAKYRSESREIALVDVMNLVHPKSEAVNKLAKGELTLTDKTWEAIISAKGSTAEAWREALEVMGHMALLRNLRNLHEQGMYGQDIAEKLTAGAADGKQLPFRYYSAYRIVEALDPKPARLLDALEESLIISLGNLPRFKGKVVSLADNSGSMDTTHTSAAGSMTLRTIANLSSVLTAMRADEGYISVFADTFKTLPIRKRASVFDALKEVEQAGHQVGGGTQFLPFWEDAIQRREHFDIVFIYSDMQAMHEKWHKGEFTDFPKVLKLYRKKVNPKVLIFSVQMGGYQDTLVPEFYDRVFVLGGWGESTLRFAAEMANVYASVG